jgi:hypothetical protein
MTHDPFQTYSGINPLATLNPWTVAAGMQTGVPYGVTPHLGQQQSAPMFGGIHPQQQLQAILASQMLHPLALAAIAGGWQHQMGGGPQAFGGQHNPMLTMQNPLLNPILAQQYYSSLYQQPTHTGSPFGQFGSPFGQGGSPFGQGGSPFGQIGSPFGQTGYPLAPQTWIGQTGLGGGYGQNPLLASLIGRGYGQGSLPWGGF